MPGKTGFVWHERSMWHMTGFAAGPPTPDPFGHLPSMGGQGLKPAEAAVNDRAAALIKAIPAG